MLASKKGTPVTSRIQSHRGRNLLTALLSTALIAALLIAAPSAAYALEAPLNQYSTGSVSAAGIPSPATPLSETDCALVIQMTGTVDNGLGRYEILDPATAAPTRTYGVGEALQYVIMPGGCDQDIEVSSTYTPPPWDPASGVGGVVFLGGTSLILNAAIDANAAGFASDHSVGAGCDGASSPSTGFGNEWVGGGGGGGIIGGGGGGAGHIGCLLYTSPSPRDATLSRIPSSA